LFGVFSIKAKKRLHSLPAVLCWN